VTTDICCLTNRYTICVCLYPPWRASVYQQAFTTIQIMLMGRGKIPFRVTSSSRTPTNKILTAAPMFSMSTCSKSCRRYQRKSHYTGNGYSGYPNRKFQNLNLLLLKNRHSTSTKIRKHSLEFFVYISCSPRCNYLRFGCL